MALQKRTQNLSKAKAVGHSIPYDFQNYVEQIRQLNAVFEAAIVAIEGRNNNLGSIISDLESIEIRRARMLALASELSALAVQEESLSPYLRKKIGSLTNTLAFAFSSTETSHVTIKRPGRPRSGPLHMQVPRLPDGLKWPTETYNKSPEHRTRGGIIRYLERVWRPLIATGHAEMRIVAILDPSLIQGLRIFGPSAAKGRVLPEHLRFLKVGEAKALKEAKASAERMTPK